MAFHSFLRRASSSTMLRRSYQREISALNVQNRSPGGVVGREIPPFVRFLTGSTEETSGHVDVPSNIVLNAVTVKCGHCANLLSFNLVPTHHLHKEITESSKCNKVGVSHSSETSCDEVGVSHSSETSGDDGLGFAIKNGPRKGTLTLIKKGQDEIIRIDVTAYPNFMDYYDAECLEYWSDPQYFADQEKIDTEKLDNPEQLVAFKPCLHLKVNIFHGYMHRKRLMFDVVAFADCPHKFMIRNMSASVVPDDQEKEKFKQPHLEGFEDFLERRGIDPKSLKYYLDSLCKPRQQFGGGDSVRKPRQFGEPRQFGGG